MDVPDLDDPDLHAVVDYGFAFRADVHDCARDLDDPELVLAYIRKVVADDPEGAVCALFAGVVEKSGGGEAETANLAWLYDEWKRRRRDG
jgi:hypothetical protein